MTPTQMRSQMRPNTGPASATMLPKIGCQYRAAAEMITPVCTRRPILARTPAANTCFRQSKGPIAIFELWLPRMGQYGAVLSALEIRT